MLTHCSINSQNNEHNIIKYHQNLQIPKLPNTKICTKILYGRHEALNLPWLQSISYILYSTKKHHHGMFPDDALTHSDLLCQNHKLYTYVNYSLMANSLVYPLLQKEYLQDPQFPRHT